MVNDEHTEDREDAEAARAEADDATASAVVAPPEDVDELAPTGGGASGNHGNGSGG